MPDLTTGACRGRTDLDWHPDGHTPAELIRDAITLCRGCALRNPCLEYALTTGQHGIWGGTTDLQRQVLRKDTSR